MRIVIPLALAISLGPGVLAAQAMPPSPPVITITRFQTWQPAQKSPSSRYLTFDMAEHHDDYRTAGLVIGAITGAALFAGVSYTLCHSSDTVHGCVGRAGATGALGAVVGGLTGMLVGGLIPKHRAAPDQ